MATSPFGHRRGQMVNGVWTLDKEPAIVALSAATEAGNAIVVTGQIKDVLGNNIAEVRSVRARTISPTAAKGVMTLSTGTEIVASSAITQITYNVSVSMQGINYSFLLQRRKPGKNIGCFH